MIKTRNIPYSVGRSTVYDSAFNIYRKLCPHYSKSEMFLLESLAGDQVDCSANYVGCNPVLSIMVYADNRIIWDGCTEAIAFAKSEMNRGLINADFNSDDYLTNIINIWTQIFPHAEKNTVCVMSYAARLKFESLPHMESENKDLCLALTLYQSVGYESLDEPCCLRVTSLDSPLWVGLNCSLDKLGDANALHCTPPSDIVRPQFVQESCTKEQYEAIVEKAKTHLQDGDIYQVQLGHTISIESSLDPWDFYLRLRERNPSPYCYVVPVGEKFLIGASPEMFLKLNNDGTLVTRPIAGTYPIEHNGKVRRITDDRKELAEHRMLLDLARNDICRVTENGTMEVPQVQEIVPYSHVQHMVSTVTGRAASGIGPGQALSELFPAGTMTGAPKIRSMEIINSLEFDSRHFYSGCVGLVGGQSVNIGLIIRSATYVDKTYSIRASAGVVLDSDPSSEWKETLGKLAACYWAICDEEIH